MLLFVYKKIFYLIFILIFILSLFVFEFLLRGIYSLGDPIIYKTNLSYRYAPSPNQSIVRSKGSKVIINENGLRATLTWDNNNSNKILFFGDSVTYGGSYIDNEEVFSELTCHNLNIINKINYLCGNAGVNAYGADNIRNRILYGEVQNQEWVIVTLIADNGFRSLQNILAIPAFLDKPKFFPAIQECFLHFIWRSNNFLRDNNNFVNTSKIQKNDHSIYFYQESFKNLNDVLINYLTQGKKILVIFHPSRQEILNRKESKEYLLMKKIFQQSESGLLFLDMFTVMESSYSTDLYFDDIHLDKKGHLLFAEKISEIITKYDKRN
jgi:lysophospholipase L1-like esterase